MRNQNRLLWLLALVQFIGLQVSGKAQSKAFEVASVRPITLGPESRQSLLRRVENGRVELSPFSARMVISYAFGIPQARIVGLPDWAGRDLFEIRAIMPPGATEGDALEMLKTLLVDRFALTTHVEQRPFPVYELSVGPSGPKFSEVEAVDELEKNFTADPASVIRDTITGSPGDERRSILRIEPDGFHTATLTRKTRYSYKLVAMNARQVDAERITMKEFIALMSQSVDRPVVDMTGLNGIYQLKTLLPPIPISPAMRTTLGDRVSSDPLGGPSLSRALEELGLKLEPKNAPVDFIVIDRIERPTAN